MYTSEEKRQIIQRFIKFKKNYRLTGQMITQETGLSPSSISNWINNKVTPNDESIRHILNLFKKYCIPGIVIIPKNKYWSTKFFLRVSDIKDPYTTYYDDGFSENEVEEFQRWVTDWAQQFPNPQIYRQYPAGPQGIAQSYLENLKINTTWCFKDVIKHYTSFEEATKQPGFRWDNFDITLIKQIISGEI